MLFTLCVRFFVPVSVVSLLEAFACCWKRKCALELQIGAQVKGRFMHLSCFARVLSYCENRK